MDDGRVSHAAADAERAWAQKQALISEVKSLTALLSSDFRAASERMNAVREQWSAIGRTGSDAVEDALWQRFRAAHDEFYAAGNKQRAQGRALAEVRQQKLRIIDEAKRIAHSTEWVSTESSFRRLFAEWQQTGQLDRNDEAELVETFKQAWQQFIGARDQHFEQARRRVEEAVQAKENLVREAAGLAQLMDLNQAKEKLRELADRWRSAAAVPELDEQRLLALFQQTQMKVLTTIEEKLRRRDEEQLMARNRKHDLIRQLEDLLHSRDYRVAKDELRQLMAQWQAIGFAGDDHEQQLNEWFKQSAERVYLAVQDAAEEYRRETTWRLEEEIRHLHDDVDELEHRIHQAEIRLSEMREHYESSRNDPRQWDRADRMAAAMADQRERIANLEAHLAKAWDEITELEARLRQVG